MLDLTNVKETSNTIPQGSYLVSLDEATIKDTKSGTGQYINCKFKVISGDETGKILFHTFNIKNENVKAVEIGLSQLKAYMKCAGFSDFMIKDVNDICGRPVEAVVKIKVDEYGEKNVISYFKSATNASATTSTVNKKTTSPF